MNNEQMCTAFPTKVINICDRCSTPTMRKNPIFVILIKIKIEDYSKARNYSL